MRTRPSSGRRRRGWRVVVVVTLVASALVSCTSGDDTRPGVVAVDAEPPEAIVDRAVAHADPWVRAEAARLLVHASPQLRDGALTTLLGDADPMVQMLAADSTLAHDPTHERARAALEAQLNSTSEPARRAAIATAGRHLDPAAQADLFEATIRTATEPSTRREATAALIELLREGSLSPARARSAEQNLTSLSTDGDVVLAGIALEYVTSVSRLAGESETLRQALKTLLAGTDVEGQERALWLLTRANDSDLSSLAYDPYVKSTDIPERARLRDLAVIALGSTGETYRVAELAAIAQRDDDRELQLAAISALARIDSPEARLALVEALEDPTLVVRRHALRAILEQRAAVTVPESVLRAEDATARVLALRVLWQQSPSRFERLVTQKLQVESYRAPLLVALAMWLDETTAAPTTGDDTDENPAAAGAPEWLTRLESSLEPLAERDRGEDPQVDTALYQLLARLRGTRSLLGELDALPLGGRYAVLRTALETGASTPAFERALVDPWFVMRLIGAIGAAR